MTGEKTGLQYKLDETEKAVTVLEDLKLNMTSEVDELRSTLRDVEEARQEARKEVQQLHNQVSCVYVPVKLFFKHFSLLFVLSYMHNTKMMKLVLI